MTCLWNKNLNKSVFIKNIIIFCFIVLWIDATNVTDDTVLNEHDCSSMDQNSKTANDVETLLIPSSSSLGRYNLI